MLQVNILGTIYTIKSEKVNDDQKLEDLLGYTDTQSKEIIIKDLSDNTDLTDNSKCKLSNLALRHEIIHAFIFESGLSYSSFSCDNWATNEEMVDWFAIQLPKIIKVYEQLNILD